LLNLQVGKVGSVVLCRAATRHFTHWAAGHRKEVVVAVAKVAASNPARKVSRFTCPL